MNLLTVIVCFITGMGAKLANKADIKILNRMTGVLLTILGIIIFIYN